MRICSMFFFICLILVSCKEKNKNVYFENGSLNYSVALKDGVYDGEYKSYYQSGKLKIEASYIKGKLNGHYLEYYESGRLKTEGRFIKGLETDFWGCYDKQGRLDSIKELIFVYPFKDDNILYNNGTKELEYDESNIEAKVIFENNKFVFKDDGSIDSEKSRFLKLISNRDTINYNEELKITFDLSHVSNVNSKIEILFRELISANKVTYKRLTIENKDALKDVAFRPKKKGANYAQGLVVIFKNDNPSEIANVIFFKKKYFSK